MKRRPAATMAPLPLFAWASRDEARRRQPAPIRLVLLEACRNAEGEPRPALMVPGARLPVIFPTLAAALAAKSGMEARA